MQWTRCCNEGCRHRVFCLHISLQIKVYIPRANATHTHTNQTTSHLIFNMQKIHLHTNTSHLRIFTSLTGKWHQKYPHVSCTDKTISWTKLFHFSAVCGKTFAVKHCQQTTRCSASRLLRIITSVNTAAVEKQ